MAKMSLQLLSSPGWITPFEMEESSAYIVAKSDALQEVDIFSRTIEREAKHRAA
jgi:hypothetical protein